MQHDYYKPTQTPPSLFAGLVLLCMVLMLMLAPKLASAKANATNALNQDTMPQYILTPNDISKQIALTLQEEGYGENIQATVKIEDPNTVYGSDEPMSVKVTSLKASNKNRQWSANVMFKNGDKILTALPMQGRFDEMIELPILSNALATGQIIEQDDIEFKTFPVHYQRAGVIRNQDELVGKSVRRTISKDRPIREHEVSAPMIVKKNDLINLIYVSNSLNITTTGQITTDAAKGDVVEVKNINSDKLVRAVIQDAKTATVMPLMQTSVSSLKGGTRDYN